MRWLVVLTLLVSCRNQVGGGTPFDAGPDALSVDVANRFVLPDGGVVEQPVDLSGRILNVYTENDTSFDVQSVVGTETGTFVVPDVTGRYLAQIGGRLVSSTAHHLSLGTNEAGRPQVYVAGTNEGLNLSAENLSPWTAQDELQFTTWGVGLIAYSTLQTPPLFKAHAPDAGDTSLQSTIVDLSGTPVPESAKGDVTYISQLSFHTLDGGGDWKAVSRAVSLPLDLEIGKPTVVETRFEPPEEQVAHVQYDARSFEGFAAQVHPDGVAFETRWLLDTHLGPFGVNTLNNGSPDLLVARLPPDAGVVSLSLPYGNPYPADWARFVIVGAAFEALYRIPLPDGGFTPPRSEVASITRFETYDTSQANVLDATLTPVRDVRLDGQAVAEGYPLVASTPVVSWTAPERGMVSRVDIDVVELRAGTTTKRYPGPSLRVVGDITRVRLPPGFLVPTAIQYLRVTATSVPASWNQEAPWRDVGPPAAAATTMTRAFRAP